jgi:hypothetical protein
VFPGKNGSERSSRISINTQLTVRSIRFSSILSPMSSPRLKSTRSKDVSWRTLLHSISLSNYPASASGYIPLLEEILRKIELLHLILRSTFRILDVHYIANANIAMKYFAFETQKPQYLQTCEQIVSQQRFKYLPEGRTTSPTLSLLWGCS